MNNCHLAATTKNTHTHTTARRMRSFSQTMNRTFTHFTPNNSKRERKCTLMSGRGCCSCSSEQRDKHTLKILSCCCYYWWTSRYRWNTTTHIVCPPSVALLEQELRNKKRHNSSIGRKVTNKVNAPLGYRHCCCCCWSCCALFLSFSLSLLYFWRASFLLIPFFPVFFFFAFSLTHSHTLSLSYSCSLSLFWRMTEKTVYQFGQVKGIFIIILVSSI